MTAYACALDDASGLGVTLPRSNAAVKMERDPRTMNRMDPETKMVHVRLEEWASWAKDAGILGYPSQSLTEKAAQYGKLGIPQQSNYKAEPIMPEHIAAVDGAVCRLGAIDQAVIKAYYLRWEPVEVMARRHSMRARQFQNVLRRARWRIGGFLAAL